MALIHIILLLFAGTLLGSFFVKYLDKGKKLTKGERIAVGAISGFIVLIFAILGLSVLIGKVVLAALIVNLAVIASLSYPVLRNFKWESLRPKFKLSISGVLLFLILLIFLAVVYQVFLVDENGFPSITILGWGDTAYHLNMIGRLAYSDPFVLEQPILSGEPLTYPLFMNFFSGMLLAMGASLSFAWFLPAFLFSISFFFLLYFVGKRFLKSKKLATLFVFLVIFGGGIGFWWFFQDVGDAYSVGGFSAVGDVIADPPLEYTHLDIDTGGKKAPGAELPLNIAWITPAVSFFSHQRTFVAGASLMLFVILGWFMHEESSVSRKKEILLWLPFLGFLPLTHTHTALAAGFLFITVVVIKWIKDGKYVKTWVYGGLLAMVIALPQLILLSATGFASPGQGSGFFSPHLGWIMCSHDISWFKCDPGVIDTDTNLLWFWTKNFGIIIWGWILAIAYFLWRKDIKTNVRKLFLPSLVLFLIPNLFLLQPWPFDNNKVLIYWWILGLLILVAGFGHLLKDRSKAVKASLVLVLLLVGGLAGSIDVSWRVRHALADVFGGKVEYHAGYYSQSEVEAADWIRENIPANDGIISSDGANNFIPMLTGRPLYLGFPGWIWTQGRGDEIERRKKGAAKLFEENDASVVCKTGTKWLMWEPHIRNVYAGAGDVVLSDLGTIEYTQQINGRDGRIIVRLNCDQ